MGRRACILLVGKFDPVVIKVVVIPKEMGVLPLFLLIPPEATRAIAEDVPYCDSCILVLGCSSASLSVHNAFRMGVDAATIQELH
jgi:hypothetical protein